MKKLLLTGVSGFLGEYIVQLPQKDWQIMGLYNNTPCTFPHIKSSKLDLTDFSATKQFLERYQADAILHLAANSNANSCEQNEASQAINVDATVHLTQWAAQQKIPFLFASTDLVFEGTHAPYSETAPTNPLMKYGQQKLEAEQQILHIYPQARIARLPLMYGLPKNGLGFMNAWVRKMKKGEKIYCFTDEFRTASYGEDVAAGLFMLINKALSGIFHLGSKESLSRFDFATQVAKHFGFDSNLIIPSLQKDVQMPAKRPANVSLNSDKAFALGFQPKTLAENLKKINL